MLRLAFWRQAVPDENATVRRWYALDAADLVTHHADFIRTVFEVNSLGIAAEGHTADSLNDVVGDQRFIADRLDQNPVACPGLVSEKPSMVTPGAWIVIMPVTVDSTTANVRPATGLPACAPLRTRDLGIVTFPGYPPTATLIVVQVISLTAS